jgi:phage-related protein
MYQKWCYAPGNDREPVREWLKGLDAADRRAIGADIKDVEFSRPLGMPLVRPLGHDLWEVRSNLVSGRIAFVIFMIEHRHMVLLHGFLKKTRKTPQDEIELALRRKRGGRK